MTKKYSGYVALLGRPNAGKSTLLNSLLGQKIVGVSSKPQTTRNRILGICPHGQAQILFIDTPGMHRLKKSVTLNSMMNREAWAAIEDASLLLYLVDSTIGLVDADLTFLKSVLESAKCPVALLLTKVDRLKASAIKQAQLKLCQAIDSMELDEKVMEKIQKPFPWTCSAKQKVSYLSLLDQVASYMPEGEWMYPEDDLTDRPQNFILSEFIREKTFRCLGEEIPYHTAVQIDKSEFGKKRASIMASIIVARNSQKGMVIGKGGSKIREIGTQARLEMEQHLGYPVYLDLRVKVDANWFERPELVSEYSSIDL